MSAAYRSAWALAWFVGSMAVAAPPPVRTVNESVTLDGVPLGTPTAQRSSFPTILHDGTTYHMWVQVTDETSDTPAGLYPLRIAGYRHATSLDGVAFTSDGALSFAGSPFATTIFGATYGEPPWIYPKAAVWNGRYTLLLWTINAFFGTPPSFGDYNYNISFNDIGAAPGNRALTHQGPLGPVPANGIAGQTAGAFGIVDGVLYYEFNSALGRAPLTGYGTQPFPATEATGPWRATATAAAVADPLPQLGYTPCHLPGGNAYMHNDARVLANADGTLGFFFTLRNCDGSRKAQQIWYMQSADAGLTWSAPQGIVTAPVTIGGQAPIGGFALADVVVVNGERVVYFNAPVAGGALAVGGAPPPAPGPTRPVPSLSMLALGLLVLTLGLVGMQRLRPLRRRRR